MEKLSIKSTIESIISDLSNNISVKEFALKIKLVAYHLKNEDFSNWITNELDGYKNVVDIPPHRILQSYVIANLVIDNGVKGANLTNHTMPLRYLKEELRNDISRIKILDSIISLESAINSDKSNIYYSTTEYERYHLSQIYEWSTILSAKKPIGKSELELIIFQFRSKLLEMFLSFNDSIFNDELDFDIMSKKKEIEKVVSQTINAGVYISDNSTANISENQILVGDKNTITLSPINKEKLTDIINQINDLNNNLENDREDIAEEIAKIKLDLNNPVQQPKIIKSAFNAIKGIAIGVGANQITPLIDEGLNHIKELI